MTRVILRSGGSGLNLRQVTQKEVAERAGVSRATVSYVLNGKSSESVPISEETRRRVLSAIEDLGYQPNLQARTLRSGKTMTIGVLLLDIHNPHFWQYLTGIEAEAHRHGYTIMLFHTALKRSEENVALRELTQKRIDGAIINASYGNKTDAGLAVSGMPIVDISSEDSPFDRVASDYRSATEQMLSHLYELGHRRFGLVYGVANPKNGIDRLEPYLAFMKKKRLGSGEDGVVACDPTQQAAYDASIQLLTRKERPTAIIAINDYLAMSAVRAAADLEIAVPRDLSVCGFDDIPFCRVMVPRLTTVRRETELGGRRAFQLLLDRMSGQTGPSRLEWIDASLQLRESTGPAPGP